VERKLPYGYVRKLLRPVVTAILTTPPYPVRPTDSLSVSFSVFGVGTVAWPTDSLEVSGDVVSFNLQQVYFPVDYQYLQSGQTTADYHESMEIGGDVLSFVLGQQYFPVDYNYLQSGQTSAEFHEDMEIGADVLSFVLGEEYFPVDYLNWPVESVEIGADVLSFNLSAA